MVTETTGTRKPAVGPGWAMLLTLLQAAGAAAAMAAPREKAVPVPATAARPAGAPQLRLVGAVQRPLTFSAAELRGMPATEQSWKRSGETHRVRGADLLALVDRAGLKEDPAVKNHRVRFAVVARGWDGYEAVLSLGELMPGIGGKTAVVACEQDGKPLAEREGPFKLIVGGDKAPTRSIWGLTELRVVDLSSTRLPNAPSHLPQ